MAAASMTAVLDHDGTQPMSCPKRKLRENDAEETLKKARHGECHGRGSGPKKTQPNKRDPKPHVASHVQRWQTKAVVGGEMQRTSLVVFVL